MRIVNHFSILNLLFCLFFMHLSGCSEPQKTRVETGNETGVLHKGNGDEPSDIDPHTTTGVPEFHIQQALFEGLVTKHPQTLEPVPAVAESWTISDDQLSYTFKLRKNTKWSDGKPLTAQDFIWSWQRALIPALGNQYAYSMYVIKNAESFHTGTIKDFSRVGVKALDDYTLQVTLNSPTSYFLQLLDHHSMYPVPQHVIEKFGSMDTRGSKWTRPENFVGNGAFTLEEWIPNQVVSVAKNPNYWDKTAVSLNEIHFYPIQQETTEERMFRSGQLHLTNTMPIQKIQTYQEANSEELKIYPYFATYYYFINVTRPPLDDVRVRQALAYSVDRYAITEHITKGGQIPALALTPPDTLGYTSKSNQVYDIELARKLLAEAGYPEGKGFPKLTLLYNTQEAHKKIALAVQQMWKTHLGIEIELQNQDWKVFLNSQSNLDYDISRSSWVGDYLDPNTFLELLTSGSGNNDSGWSNNRYDELIRLAASSKSRAERYGFFQQAEKILLEQTPLIPIYTYTRSYLKKTSVKGHYDNILDYHPYKHIRLEAQ